MMQNRKCTELMAAQDTEQYTAYQIKETAIPTNCRQNAELL
jgi:hypothetical protein